MLRRGPGAENLEGLIEEGGIERRRYGVVERTPTNIDLTCVFTQTPYMRSNP
jgi:hypothetical protein